MALRDKHEFRKARLALRALIGVYPKEAWVEPQLTKLLPMAAKPQLDVSVVTPLWVLQPDTPALGGRVGG